MLANYLFAVLKLVCVCVSPVVTCEFVHLDSSVCAAGLLSLQAMYLISGHFLKVTSVVICSSYKSCTTDTQLE